MSTGIQELKQRTWYTKLNTWWLQRSLRPRSSQAKPASSALVAIGYLPCARHLLRELGPSQMAMSILDRCKPDIESLKR